MGEYFYFFTALHMQARTCGEIFLVTRNRILHLIFHNKHGGRHC